MSREWIPVDIGLAQKPEILELVEVAAVAPEVACWRMVALWGWFSLNSADGTARATPERLATACGGDADWWRAVADVGWLEFDQTAQTATIPGWDVRFSGSAKSRAADANRKYAERKGNVRVSPDKCPEIPGQMSGVSRTNVQKSRTIEEQSIGEHSSPTSSARGCSAGGSPEPEPETKPTPPPVSDAQWQAFSQRWNSSAGERYRSPRQPPAFAQRMVDPEWLALALLAIDRLPACKWFATPVNLPQFCKPDFVDEVLAGKYVGAKPAPRISPRLGLTDVAPPREFAGDDAKRFEETRQREIQKLRAASGA